MLKHPNSEVAIEDRDPASLAKLAATGDTAATAQLLRIVAPEMLRVVRGVMGPFSDDVDDALQQALVGLIHALPSFRGECAPAGYACRIAFRAALRARKNARRQWLRQDHAAETELIADSASIGADFDAQQRTNLLRSLLDELADEQAEALAMRTILGWSLEEIAAASGAPLNTVRSRLRLAKEALRKRIEADASLKDALGVES